MKDPLSIKLKIYQTRYINTGGIIAAGVQKEKIKKSLTFKKASK
jgi:hypothetical protein